MNKQENIINYPNSVDTRVALLEMSIININETMKEIKSELKDIRKENKADFWKLAGFIAALAGIVAHGFHWF